MALCILRLERNLDLSPKFDLQSLKLTQKPPDNVQQPTSGLETNILSLLSVRKQQRLYIEISLFRPKNAKGVSRGMLLMFSQK